MLHRKKLIHAMASLQAPVPGPADDVDLSGLTDMAREMLETDPEVREAS